MLEILVVDDEKDICWALEKGLVDEGVHITQVHRGEDAIEAVRGRSFDAAIIDVKLPGKSGIEVSRVIRELAPRLPIVMISGYHYEEDQPIQEGLQRGEYQGFISKPFELDEISALLRRIIQEGGGSPSMEPVIGPEGQTERR
jgi:DNA-binding response OmpR family regulator